MDSNRKEIRLFYLSFSIFQFANSIVQIFIPLYFYNKGFSLSSILLFFAITQVGRLAFLPVAAWLSSSYGAKRIMSVSFIFSIIYYIFLGMVENVSGAFYASAFIFGSVQALQWLPFLVHLSKMSPNENRGKIYSKLNSYTTIGNALGPLLGGFIISFYGFKFVFYAVIALILPAIYFLLLTPEISKIRKIKFSLVSVRKIYPDMIANGAFNFEIYLGNTIWPIFIFVILPQYNTIGLIQTASLFMSLVALHFIGKWTDRSSRKKVLLWGSVLNSFTGFFRIYANSFLSIFMLNSAAIFTGTLQGIPWNVKLQEHMDEEPRTEYVAIFEIGGALIAFLGLLTFAVISIFLPFRDVLVYGIIISAISGLFVNLIRK